MDKQALDRWITGNYGADDPAAQPAASGDFCESAEVELVDIEGEVDEGDVRVESFQVGEVHVSRSTPLGELLCDEVQRRLGDVLRDAVGEKR